MLIIVGHPDIALLLMSCSWKHTDSLSLFSRKVVSDSCDPVFLPKRFKTECNQDFGPNYWFTGKTGDEETY